MQAFCSIKLSKLYAKLKQLYSEFFINERLVLYATSGMKGWSKNQTESFQNEAIYSIITCSLSLNRQRIGVLCLIVNCQSIS